MGNQSSISYENSPNKFLIKDMSVTNFEIMVRNNDYFKRLDSDLEVWRYFLLRDFGWTSKTNDPKKEYYMALKSRYTFPDLNNYFNVEIKPCNTPGKYEISNDGYKTTVSIEYFDTFIPHRTDETIVEVYDPNSNIVRDNSIRKINLVEIRDGVVVDEKSNYSIVLSNDKMYYVSKSTLDYKIKLPNFN